MVVRGSRPCIGKDLNADGRSELRLLGAESKLDLFGRGMGCWSKLPVADRVQSGLCQHRIAALHSRQGHLAVRRDHHRKPHVSAKVAASRQLWVGRRNPVNHIALTRGITLCHGRTWEDHDRSQEDQEPNRILRRSHRHRDSRKNGFVLDLDFPSVLSPMHVTSVPQAVGPSGCGARRDEKLRVVRPRSRAIKFGDVICQV